MQPYEDITSSKPIIDIRMSNGKIAKIAPNLAAASSEKEINERKAKEKENNRDFNRRTG